MYWQLTLKCIQNTRWTDEQTARCEGKANTGNVYSWLLNNPRVRDANLPCSQNSNYNFITVSMGSVNCRLCSTTVLFLAKESAYKQIHVVQSFTAEGTTIPQNQDSGHMGVFKFSGCLKLFKIKCVKENNQQQRGEFLLLSVPLTPAQSMPLTSTWRGPDSTVQRERTQACAQTDRRQRDKGLEISVYMGPSVMYRGSKPSEKQRPTQTEAARATSMAGKTGKKKSETWISSFQAIRD